MEGFTMMWRATTNPQPKPQTELPPEMIAREEAIKILRSEFLKLVDDEKSICKVAAERGIFCKGFQRYSDFELRKRYRWIARKDRRYTREEIEDLANRWQLARQDVDELPLACDVQQAEHDSCRGWDDFSNEELAKFLYQMTGRNIAVE
jgi:hypothetical protein